MLRCLHTADLLSDEYTLSNHPEGLLRAEYSNQKLVVRNELEGIWKYSDWLPVSETSGQIAGTLSYKSEGLASELGMSNLWIAYHGYWPEKGGLCPTTSFKDLEAVCTIQRLKDFGCKGMICASAGNTARSFTHFGGEENYPILVIVAEKHMDRIWVPQDHKVGSVTIFAIGDGAGYNDAIDVANKVAEKIQWQLEGGAKNIARRDGIGSLIIDAAHKIGRLPDHYFQAVGGGPGPIGVHEMASRMYNAKILEGPIPRQHLSQNVEHCPIFNAWQAKRDTLSPEDFPASAVEVFSDYLVNNSPAYSVRGGVYDILKESNGMVWVTTSEESQEAAMMFEEYEGIDIMSPGAVALASLRKALSSGEVDIDDYVVLNISGGGTRRLFENVQTKIVRPAMILSKDSAVDAIVDYVESRYT